MIQAVDDKVWGKRDVFAIYDNKKNSRLIIIIIKIIIIYVYIIQIRHTDDFPSRGARIIQHNTTYCDIDIIVWRLQFIPVWFLARDYSRKFDNKTNSRLIIIIIKIIIIYIIQIRHTDDFPSRGARLVQHNTT